MPDLEDGLSRGDVSCVQSPLELAHFVLSAVRPICQVTKLRSDGRSGLTQPSVSWAQATVCPSRHLLEESGPSRMWLVLDLRELCL